MLRRPNPRNQAHSTGAAGHVAYDDAALVGRVKAGETQAYGLLVEKYQDRVFNACWRICGHLEDARDLTQDAFLKAFSSLESFRGDSSFYTWIFRVAVNLTLSHLRSGRNRRTVSLDAALDAFGTQAERLALRLRDMNADDPAEVAASRDLESAAIDALSGLEEDQRAVVVLRDIEGLDYHEIGVVLEIPPGTVRSRLHRARMALRESVFGDTRGAG